MRTPRLVAVAVFTLLLVACGHEGDTPEPDEPTTHEVKVQSNFEVRLRSLSSTPKQVDDVRSVDGTPLPEEEAEALLDRMPPMESSGSESDTSTFEGGPSPPARKSTTATTVNPKEKVEKPPSSTSSEPEDLRVLRRVPAGDPSRVHRVSVTFSKPMVSLGTRDQTSQKLPVQLEPDVDGTWRWVGTRTVVFRPAGDEFPGATEFTATVDDAVESADGTRLGEDIQLTFRTTPVQVEYCYPLLDDDPLHPLILLEFNRPVDAGRILEDLKLLGEQRDPRLRLATKQEIRDSERATNLVETIPDGESAVFRPTMKLKPATTYSVEVQTDISGENKDVALSTVFATYKPLRLEKSWCTGRCESDSSFKLKFNNQLDTDAFEASVVEVRPSMEERTVEVDGNEVVVTADFQTGRDYDVTIDDALTDRFGQTLDVSVSRDFYVPFQQPRLGDVPSMMVADPGRRPTIGVPTASLKYFDVTAYRVDPADWPLYDLGELFDDSDSVQEYGTEVGTERIQVANPRSGLVENRIDLSKWLAEEHGHLLLRIERGEPLEDAPDPRYSLSERWTWVQATDLAPVMFVDPAATYAWVTDLADGMPVSGAAIEVLRDSDWPIMESGPEGLAVEDRTLDDATSVHSSALMVSRGDDTAIVPIEETSVDTLPRRQDRDDYRWHVYTDRGLYRPGETVDMKGWVRQVDASDSGLLRQVDRSSALKWELRGPGYERIAGGDTSLSEVGGFHVEFTLPEDVQLGRARFSVSLEDTSAESGTSFDVREFRTPKFELDVAAPGGPFVIGETATAKVSANYYRGGSLSGSDVTWRVESDTGEYAPPGWEEFSFGRWSSPWYHQQPGDSDMDVLDGVLKKGGIHRLGLETGPTDLDLPIAITAEAIVQDVNRQTVAGSMSTLVHPAEAYIGLRKPGHLVDRGERFEVQAVGVSIGGEPLKGRRMEISMGTQSCERASTGKTPVSCTFEARRGGTHVITGEIFDRDGRSSVSQRRIWVPGHDPGADDEIKKQEVELIPDKSTYHAGDTAEVLVQSPFETAQGLLLVSRDEIVATKRFEVEDHSATLAIAIDAADIPNAQLAVQLVGRGNVNGRSGPVHATGKLGLDVSPSARRLDVSLHPQTVGLKPSGELTVGLEVERPDGTPAVRSEVALAVVDEAVLATGGYELDDPLSSFYPRYYSSIEAVSFRDLVRLTPEDVPRIPKNTIDIENLGVNRMMASENLGSGALKNIFNNEDGISARMNREMGSEPPTRTPRAKPGSQASQIRLRRDLRPAAYFGPRVTTDEDGEATVSFELPDNLTRWRLMAVAADGAEYFGTAEETVTVRKPVSISPSFPKFLNLGDRAQLPLVVHNQTRRDRTIKLAARTSNLNIDGARGVSVEVPALERVEVQFPSRTKDSGTAQVQLAASSGDWADGVEESIPVHRPATTEAFATYGSIDSPEATVEHPVEKPEDVIPDYGSLNVTTSSTALQKLTDAFIYLVDYPYECTEQASSRMLGIAALRDVLGVFESASLPDAEELKGSIQEDIELLENRQRYGGGFTLWDDGTDVWPYASLHATLALHRVEEAGYEVPADMLEDAAEYAAEIDAAGLDPDWGKNCASPSMPTPSMYSTRSAKGGRKRRRSYWVTRSSEKQSHSKASGGCCRPSVTNRLPTSTSKGRCVAFAIASQRRLRRPTLPPNTPRKMDTSSCSRADGPMPYCWKAGWTTAPSPI